MANLSQTILLKITRCVARLFNPPAALSKPALLGRLAALGKFVAPASLTARIALGKPAPPALLGKLAMPAMLGRLVVLATLAGCSVLNRGSPQVTATPIPTSIIQGLQVIPPQTCQVAAQDMIRVERPQGDLIAWAPDKDTVAYIASTLGSSWNVGDLYLLSGPRFDSPVRIATQTAGELTWSPDGSSIAYLGLRLSDNLYTIGLAYPNGRIPLDLFPGEAARTDSYASQKAILQWVDSGRLRIVTSCGLDCLQAIDFAIPSGIFAPLTGQIPRTWDFWSVHNNQPAEIQPLLADLKGQLNWSPDERRIAHIDENGNIWIIDEDTKGIFPLDLGFYGTATETDWSYDSQYLAVHVDQNLRIFSFNCP